MAAGGAAMFGDRTAAKHPRSRRRPHASPPAAGSASVDDFLTDAAAERLSRGLARGDPAALATLYELRFDWMISLLQRSTRRDESFAMDCAQDAWMRVARTPARCASAVALDAWLRRVALSAALDRLRSDAARRVREAEAVRVSDGVRSPSALAHALESIESVRDALDRAMMRSSPDDRGMLLMRFRAGMTLGQIGAACGLGAAAVDSRLRRLLAAMKDEHATQVRARERVGTKEEK